MYILLFILRYTTLYRVNHANENNGLISLSISQSMYTYRYRREKLFSAFRDSSCIRVIQMHARIDDAPAMRSNRLRYFHTSTMHTHAH